MTFKKWAAEFFVGNTVRMNVFARGPIPRPIMTTVKGLPTPCADIQTVDKCFNGTLILFTDFYLSHKLKCKDRPY